ncbi:CHAT domain-containing protein [Lactarius sanguifluus]|nr:CHAT domain-containing protein [Lactarius sanguifluus]
MNPELSIADIDGHITFVHNILSPFPRSHHTRFDFVHILGKARFARYERSQQKEDLDKCIVHYTEAIFLPRVSSVELSLGVVQLLYHLALVLLERSKKFKQPEDVKYSVEYLRYLRGLPLDSFDVRRDNVTASLIRALATQVRLDVGDGTQDNIKGMMDLCRELLTSNILAEFPASSFQSLNQAVDSEFIRGRPIPLLGEVIECLRDAVKVCPPGSHYILYALANQLCIRFIKVHSNEDYEEATALLEMVLDANQPEECPGWIRNLASNIQKWQFLVSVPNLALLPLMKGFVFKSLRAWRSKPDCGLETTVLPRVLEEANSYTSQVVDLSSSESLERSGELLLESDAVRESYSMTGMAEKIQHLEELLSITPTKTERHEQYLSRLAKWYESKFYRTNDISDLEESIKYSRLLLNATHYSSDLRKYIALDQLHDILLLAFEKTGKITYLGESIAVGYDILKLEAPQHTHFRAIQKLVSSLLSREQLLGGREDFHESIRLMSTVIDNQLGHEPDRFRLSCEWALLARSAGHPTTLTAYKSAMSLMRRSLFFAPTVSVQHTRLVAMGEYCQAMPLDYASYQIYLGRFEEAVETLEQGRALLWSEMRGLRTPIAQLTEEDSPLAKRLAEINQELEALTISVTPSGRPEMGDGTDPFGRLVVKRQKLVEEWDALISQIQDRPGLGGFLTTPPFTALRSAASRGPVILINHCRWRSDILIIVHNYLPSFIPATDDFYDRANDLRDGLVEARKHGLDSVEYQDALSSVLKGLYELVGEPVIERLRVLGVPEQSRIWWCPTSVFCSLPLHAMGPIPSGDTSDERYFSDLYIPSYTPSLSALIESRKASRQTLDKPSLLLVAQPDDSLPGVWGEMKVIRSLEARVTVTDLVSSAASPSSVIEGLRGSHFAHFACHGVLETGKPFEASFKLHGSSRLTLLDIVRSRLPDAEFAFLSCCHAAEITEESIADEALHLTAAMQYCGFRSVVGTMWEMADTDGRDLAKSFYKSLLSSNQDAGVPYYERSARALRDATQKLRKKRGITLERWVNFVHYGA